MSAFDFYFRDSDNIRYLKNEQNVLNVLTYSREQIQLYESSQITLTDWVEFLIEFLKLFKKAEAHFNVNLHIGELEDSFHDVYYWGASHWYAVDWQFQKHEELEPDFINEFIEYLDSIESFVKETGFKEQAFGLDTTFNLPPFGKITILQGILFLLIGVWLFTVFFGKQKPLQRRQTSATEAATLIKAVK